MSYRVTIIERGRQGPQGVQGPTGPAGSYETLAELNTDITDATLDDVTGTRTPAAHAASHATGGSDALAPADIGAATSAQGALADTAVQPARLINTGTGLDGGGDLSADRTLALDAATIASLALADKLPDPTGQTAGRVVQTDGANGYAVEPLNAGAVAALLLTDEIKIWDSFRRTAASLGTADSGHAWIDVEGGFSTDGRSAGFVANPSMSWIDRGTVEIHGIQVFGYYSNRTGTAIRGFVVGRDSSNYLLADFGDGNLLSIITVIDGTSATRATSSVITGARAYQRASVLMGELTVTVKGTHPLVVFRFPSLGPNAAAVWEDTGAILTTDLFPATTDMRYVGLRATNLGRFYSFGVRNIALPEA